jgi:hypothetical protein
VGVERAFPSWTSDQQHHQLVDRFVADSERSTIAAF